MVGVKQWKPSCPNLFCRLVDSRDIVELTLKQLDCEVTIRKREAMPQLQSAPQPEVFYSPPSPTMPPVATASNPAPAVAASTPSPSTSLAIKSAKSSHPPLKSPMAGTFYRSPAPGEPAFVKVDLLCNIIFVPFLVSCFFALLCDGTLSLGWRQSKERASLVYH